MWCDIMQLLKSLFWILFDNLENEKILFDNLENENLENVYAMLSEKENPNLIPILLSKVCWEKGWKESNWKLTFLDGEPWNVLCT